ncbi:MAG: DUF1800 domain-containing protein, partial [Bacteroidota bacterium]
MTRKDSKATAAAAPVAPTAASLAPYSGEWGIEQAAHLFRRTTFGLRIDKIKAAASDGLNATIDSLLSDQPMPAAPISWDGEDAVVDRGEDWTESLYPSNVNKVPSRSSRYRSLYGWSMGQLLDQGVSIREKMTLFWHNHFAVDRPTVNDPKFLYQYMMLLRENALGNFKTLVDKITVNPAMLRYLNGRQNTKNKPNENYARELLELFALGKGPTVGEGDYTNYTEDDVLALAKVLTGWIDDGYNSEEIAIPTSRFRAFQHDTSDKQLSHRFDNVKISDGGADEYKQLIDIIFQKPEAARFIVRKLYRWFVNFDLTNEIETQVIEPLAQQLIDENFEVKPVLQTLLSSEHFYSEAVRGAIIKNPLEFVFSVINQFEVSMPEDEVKWYEVLMAFHNFMDRLDMQLFYPPNVAGWGAYYQEPSFYQSWISSATLPERMQLTDRLADRGQTFRQFKLLINGLDMIERLDDPSDPNTMIDELARLLLPKP